MALGGLTSRTPSAVLLDALGTLLYLEAPWPRLAGALRARHGVEVTDAQAEDALRAEIAYYRAHHDEGRDAASLAALRRRCVEVLASRLPAPARAIHAPQLLPTLLEALVFVPYQEVPASLAALRAAGPRLVVVSNWDVSLHEVLERIGLRGLVDGVVTSAEVGAGKPSPRIFAAALELAGATPGQAVHVGDSVEADVRGAIAAGIAAVLVRRDGAASGAAPAGVQVIASLDELARTLPDRSSPPAP